MYIAYIYLHNTNTTHLTLCARIFCALWMLLLLLLHDAGARSRSSSVLYVWLDAVFPDNGIALSNQMIYLRHAHARTQYTSAHHRTIAPAHREGLFPGHACAIARTGVEWWWRWWCSTSAHLLRAPVWVGCGVGGVVASSESWLETLLGDCVLFERKCARMRRMFVCVCFACVAQLAENILRRSRRSRASLPFQFHHLPSILTQITPVVRSEPNKNALIHCRA